MHAPCTRRAAAVLAALAAGAALAAAPAPARAARTAGPVLEGKVTRVIDGDTLQVQASVSGPPLTVRLRDIDAPEICQVWGTQSRDALAELVKGRTVEVRTVARDVHGRTVAAVYVDGVNVGVRLVEEGHAWSARGKWDRGPLMKQERMAWSLRRGLHQDRAAINPKDFRAAHGSCTAQAAQ